MESRTNISEEMADSFIGQKSPEIKPKLNDTNPSLLNLSSGIFSKRTCEKDSFDSDKNGKNFISSNNLISFNKSSFFVSGHFKSSSNEVFKIQKIYFSENEENEKNDIEENSNNNLNYNFENEFINFGQNNVNEEEKIIFCENINETSEEDDDEGLYILSMLRKGRKC